MIPELLSHAVTSTTHDKRRLKTVRIPVNIPETIKNF